MIYHHRRAGLAGPGDSAYDRGALEESIMANEEVKPRPPQWWLMVMWLTCALIVISFALFSYISGWFYPLKE